MTPNTETIAATLGNLRKGLVAQGFGDEEAYQIVLDLIRRPDMPAVLASAHA